MDCRPCRIVSSNRLKNRCSNWSVIFLTMGLSMEASTIAVTEQMMSGPKRLANTEAAN